MTQRHIGTAVSVPMAAFDPVATELFDLHRDLFAPPYVSDERVANAIRAKSLAYRLGDKVDGGLKSKYLSRVIKIEDGLSWSKMFGNFMGTAAAFHAMLNSTKRNDDGLVSLHDSVAIRGMFIALHKYTAAVNELEGKDVSEVMKNSATFCGGLLDRLQALFHVPEHWATVAEDGKTTVVREIDRQALGDPNLKRLPLVEMTTGAQTLLTAAGLEAFKDWAQRAADPANFINAIMIPPEAVVGADRPTVEVDHFVRVDGLPAPHPSVASIVHRVMVELVAIAEQTQMPALQFRYNGWRQAYEARVPASHADIFLRAVKNNEEMGSLRGEHDWWVERVGEQVKVVIPTQPATHIDHFASFSRAMLRKVAALYDHFLRVNRSEAVDLDAPDDEGVSLRVKLDSFEEGFQELLGMQKFLEGERARDPNLRTQESYAVSALLDRLMFSTKAYRDVYLNRNQPDSLSTNIGIALTSNVFSLLEHIPSANNRVPKVDVVSTGPRFPFTPFKWVESHQLMLSLYSLMVNVAGTFDEDSRYPVDVYVNYAWDPQNRRVVFRNEDGRFIDYFRGLNPDMEPHLIPGPAREIYSLARKVAPPGQMLTIDPDKNLMFVPIKVDESAVPQSPSMASFSAPHPSLLIRERR